MECGDNSPPSQNGSSIQFVTPPIKQSPRIPLIFGFDNNANDRLGVGSPDMYPTLRQIHFDAIHQVIWKLLMFDGDSKILQYRIETIRFYDHVVLQHTHPR